MVFDIRLQRYRDKKIRELVEKTQFFCASRFILLKIKGRANVSQKMKLYGFTQFGFIIKNFIICVLKR